jgi:Temperature dependent protein affecting M2 dsRNA replication
VSFTCLTKIHTLIALDELTNGLHISLPFINEVSAGLGIAVKTYLDELSNEAEPIHPDTRAKQKEKLSAMFAQAADIEGDVDQAFRVWDAVRAVYSF